MDARDPSPSAAAGPPRFGLFLNMGTQLLPRPEDVFAFTLEQAELADRLGYDDLWVTEHHFIPFGMNPNALAAASFLLGRTRRVRVGTAVALSPLYHPVALAEQAALLAQLSGGRFDLGVGRGGYVRDYEVLGVDTERWDVEPEATLEVLVRAFAGEAVSARNPWFAFEDVTIVPPPPELGPPGLFAATSTEKGIECAARHGVPLQFYYALPVSFRQALVERYEAARPADKPAPDHLHTLIAIVTDDPDATRARLSDALVTSFRSGDWPKVPQAPERHVDAKGRPMTPEKMARFVAKGALLGPPDVLAAELEAFVEATGARRIALYVEALAEADVTLESIERFATEVRPRLGTSAH